MINWGVNIGGMGMGRPCDGAEYQKHGLYGTDYAKNTQAEINYLAAKGFDYHRLQFMWHRIQHALGGDLDATDLGYLDDMVDMVNAAGMLCCISPHDGGEYFQDSDDTMHTLGGAVATPAQFADLWSKLATHFQGRAGRPWAYELMNEPNTCTGADGTYAKWKAAAQAAITAIRLVDATTPIIVGGFAWQSCKDWYESGNDDLKTLTGTGLIFAGHQYFDYDYAGLYAYPSPGDAITGYTGALKDRARATLFPFVTWLRANGFTGIIGEISAPGTNFWLEVLRAAYDFLEECDDVIQCVQLQSGWTYPWKDTYVLSVFPDSSETPDENDINGAEQAETVMTYTDHVGQEYEGIVPTTIDAITANGNWECPAGVRYVQLLLVGGGGSGGKSYGGGGGGGGVLYVARHEVTPGATYAAVIGAGGAAKAADGQGNDGANTTFMGFTAFGGGGGGGSEGSPNGRAGGCGGGARTTGTGGAATQGYAGGSASFRSAGGGGAAHEGMEDIYDSNYNFAPGGSGKDYSAIFGTTYGESGFFGGGGGGSATSTTGKGYGGIGGGGEGSIGNWAEPPTGTAPTAGTANTGGGGGGDESGYGSGAGGTGVVLIGYGGDVSATGMSTLTGISSLTIA